MSTAELKGWDRLRHGGLLLDAQRQREIATHEPEPLPSYYEHTFRKQALAILDANGNVPAFVAFVLQRVCGFSESTGSWQRGNQVSSEWGRVAITGETVKPRQLWRGREGGVLPVFLDREKRIGIGRGRKATSQVLQWLRAGDEQLALVTNGHQWRLIFAGLDFHAWCEWDLDLWFEEGELSPQVAALRILLAPVHWSPIEKEAPAPLLQAVLDSRKGQAELSQVLGERVREAVELLVQGHGEALKERCADVDPADIYRAAVRVVMRLVVVLFAESRELLPRDNALYHGSYGLTGLLEELEKIAARGGGRLVRSYSAWPRVLALFRLVHDGSHHPSLPVPAYGGELFAPGEPESPDGLSRALAVFESACFDHEVLPDRNVHRVLERITRTRVKLRHGRASTWMPAPVDFSDLSSEYIGILYEGLLDFELKTAPTGDPIVFLAVGNQPALPLSRLQEMDDTALKNLLETMKDTSSGDDEAADEEDARDEVDGDAKTAEESSDESETPEDEADEQMESAEEDAEDEDERHTTRTRAEAWARRAVEVGKLARKPRGKLTPEKKLAFDAAVARKAHQLVTRVVLPGEWYLVRWGGTRKGSGTFYTRPGLAVPTVQRTLRPLAWDPPVGEDGTPNRDAPPAQWTPKKPEEILALKVVDPACGSGTFPVATLRFLTDTLYKSLFFHERLTGDTGQPFDEILGLRAETPDNELLGATRLPSRPENDGFEDQTKALLRRHVIERCIYGVDLDPLAVELCRLALWIETMDRSLPFSFLDHKVKCGNALVGAWFDQFQHYPVMAWKNREGGDKGHNNGVHFQKDARTKAVKAFVKEHLQLDLADTIVGQHRFERKALEDPARVHEEALAVLSRLHDLPVQDTAERARLYREELLGSEAYRSLKEAMDLWCACWFWPAEELEQAPLPSTLAEPPEAIRAVSARLAAEKRFFHWELEFPDVFRAAGSGFDAVLGNPPWDIAKPLSKEFFSNIDPLYRSYGKQEALRYQTDYFADEALERGWLDYNADFRAQSNFMKYGASAFGDPDRADKSQDRFSIKRGKTNAELHARWRDARSESRGFADPKHSFRHQGSADINLYKLFLEQAHALLADGGRMGFIVPSGLYSDHGTGALRELFLEHCRWEWLFNFINWNKIFPSIYYRFKFNALVIEKGGVTDAVNTAFVRTRLEDWAHGEAVSTPYTREQVERYSPRSRAILEIQSTRDLEILEKIYANSVLLGDDGPDGWGITYAREFDMSNDSNLFSTRPRWEEQGYRPDEYSRWLKGDWRPIDELWAELGTRPLPEDERRCAQPPYHRLPNPRADIPEGIILSREADAWLREERVLDTALPLYQGRMIGQFDFSEKGWVRGTGRTAKWEFVEWSEKQIRPQYLMPLDTYRSKTLERHLKSTKKTYGADRMNLEEKRLSDPTEFAKWWSNREPRISFMDVTSATNARTMIASTTPALPSGNKVPLLYSPKYDETILCAILNSFSYDFVMRRRMSGLSAGYFVIQETPLPPPNSPILALAPVRRFAWSLCRSSEIFADQWCQYAEQTPSDPWRSYWSLTMAERLRVQCILDAIVGAVSGVEPSLFADVLASCDRVDPGEGSPDPAGFWRVDKDKKPELRRSVLTLVAVQALWESIGSFGGNLERGIEAFCSQNDGEGWKLPETLRLADYGLGHDERAKEHQPVASGLGPRFYDWQLAQDPEESWRECHLHARNLFGEEGYRQLLDNIEGEKRGEQPQQAGPAASTVQVEAKSQGTLFD